MSLQVEGASTRIHSGGLFSEIRFTCTLKFGVVVFFTFPFFECCGAERLGGSAEIEAMSNQQLDVGRAFAKLQTQFSDFLQNLPLFNPNAVSLKSKLEQIICDRGRGTISLGFRQTSGGPLWARIGQSESVVGRNTTGMSTEAIAERLAGVSLYALTNAAEEFVLVSGVRTKKSIGLFCFKEEDAEALLDQMKAMSPPGMRNGSRVVPVSLNQVGLILLIFRGFCFGRL